MNNITITEYLKNELKEKKVICALFTTFNFEVDFFESEVIPMLFNESNYYSSHPFIKRYQVRKELEKSNIDIELFYDKNIYDSNDSPQMEYMFHSVNHQNGAFHPKIIYIILEDSKGNQSLLLYSGSNNITNAGWWDNIECGNYIIIDKKHSISETTFKNINNSLNYLNSKKKFLHDKSAPTNKIKNFLKDNVKISNHNIHFYFQKNKIDNLKTFLDYNLNEELTNLEIISPFFSDAEKSDLDKVFAKYMISLYLPRNQQNIALCKETYYYYCGNKENIKWCDFNNLTKKALGIYCEYNNSQYRKLHAKIFHFYNRTSSWFLTGSFNFTHKAFNDNIEAGFLYKNKTHHFPLLEPIENIESFENNLYDTDNPDEVVGIKIDINILFDWDKKYLFIEQNYEDMLKEIILTNSANIKLQKIKFNTEPGAFKANELLIKYLEKSSYIYINEQSILVQHINWKYKPLNLPPMKLSELLSIYSLASDTKMNDNKYILHILNVFASKGELLENSVNEISSPNNNFFSEYSEIFFSFRKLNKVLENAITENETEILEYYFRMEYPESFSSVVKALIEEDIDIAIKYIVLLCLDEIYENVKVYLKDKLYKTIKLEIQNIRKLITNSEFDNSINQNDFLDWFELEFKLKHKVSNND